MSTAFKISNGDISYQNGRGVEVEGTDLLKQEVALWLEQTYGKDIYHPKFGSYLREFTPSKTTEENLAEMKSQTLQTLANLIQAQKTEQGANPANTTPSQLIKSVDSVTVKDGKILIDITSQSNQNVGYSL
jgi:hypothetical protein